MSSFAPFLFSFEFVSLSFVTVCDPNHHIKLGSPVHGTFRVIKNAEKLRQLFCLIQSHNILPICYSLRKKNHISPILSAINPHISWAYIQSNKEKYPSLGPNRARLTKLNGEAVIEYGEGLSACEGKEELRIAVCSALGLDMEESKSRIVIFESNTEEVAKLRENGYRFVFAEIPNSMEEVKTSVVSGMQMFYGLTSNPTNN
jgi:hypothetical protein